MNLKQKKVLFQYSAVVIALFVIHATTVNAAEVDADRSAIVVISSQMGVSMTGRFRDFTGTVNFDPAKPAVGSTMLSIKTASYDMGNDIYGEQIRDRKWFDTARFPFATFVSSAITPVQDGRYTVVGRLTIKGQSRAVTAPVTITREGSSLVFDGSLPISRTQYGIGVDEWKDTSIVADSVVIRFHIVSRQP
ncbi:YceI family protein [Paraburkholderia terrae]|uniref:YceI family protein n=1 Tax=Paraburkholderia terrae TaxID=311230 RepID=UPI0030E44BF1